MAPPARTDPPLAEAVDLDRALDEVFAAPPEEFVRARDAVVKRLRAEKRRDDAAQVAALRKPNRLVWALDQLALAEDPTLPELLEAVDDTQGAAGGDLRAAVEDLREAVRAASIAAARRLDPARSSDRADLAAALHAVVGDAEALEALATGRLFEIPTANPFGLAVAPDVSTAAKPAKAKKAAAKPKAKTAKAAAPDTLALRRARHEAEEALDAAKRASAEAQDEVREAASAQDDAEAALQAAKAAHRAAAEALAAAQAERNEAAAAVDDAVTAADSAAATEAEAAAALEQAVKAAAKG